jgi:signal transduction histidine kinase
MGFTTRNFAVTALVATVASLAYWLAATLIGPHLFHEHMALAGVAPDDPATLHAEEAFRAATQLSLGISFGAACVAALAASVFASWRLVAPLKELSRAACRAASGDFTERIDEARAGSGFTAVVQAFNRMSDKLQRSQAVQQRLLADVAHELRTPAAVLLATVDGVRDGVRPLDEATLGVLDRQVDRITKLADDLGAVTRAESQSERLELAPVTASALVADALQAVAERHPNVHLESSVPDGLPNVLADRTRIGQVFANLLDNALRHTPADGKVRVEATLLPTSSRDYIQFTVKDSGTGISPEHLPHLFDRFYRADQARDRRQGGSGVGLAIVKALVAAHNGTISATSDGAGLGASFSFTLPVADLVSRLGSS